MKIVEVTEEVSEAVAGASSEINSVASEVNRNFSKKRLFK